MESALTLGSRERQLGLSFKKLFQHDSGVELKVRGALNTITASCEVQGALNKVRRRAKGAVLLPLFALSRTVQGVSCSPAV
jgi:hypothetical protein